jgi:hypothetical protein
VNGRHLAQHLDVVRVQRDDLRVVRLRVLEVTEVLAVPLAQAEAELDLGLVVRLLRQPSVGGVD